MPVSREWISLARVSVLVPISSRSTAAAAADGASPTTVPPSPVQARDSTRIAVVLPVPAGARASWTRAPEVASSRTSCTWPGLSSTPLAVDSSRAMSIVSALMVRPSRAGGGRDDRLLGGDDLARGVELRPGDGVHRRAVRAAQRGRLADRFGAVQGQLTSLGDSARATTSSTARSTSTRGCRRRGPAVRPRRGRDSPARPRGRTARRSEPRSRSPAPSGW